MNEVLLEPLLLLPLLENAVKHSALGTDAHAWVIMDLRQDGSHLTDRKRLIPDGVVNMKSRKTFARVHIGFVNIDANKAKCAPVAANRA